MSQRKDQILAEFQGRADIVGLSKAVDELVEALEYAELRYDRLEKQVLALVQPIDRRGIFLPPLGGKA